MNFKYVYKVIYALILAHMVHKIYCRATAKYHIPLLAVILGFIGIDLSVRPVRYDEDGDVIEDDGEYDSGRRVVSGRLLADAPKHVSLVRLVGRAMNVPSRFVDQSSSVKKG